MTKLERLLQADRLSKEIAKIMANYIRDGMCPVDMREILKDSASSLGNMKPVKRMEYGK